MSQSFVLCLFTLALVARTVVCGGYYVVSNNRYYVSYPQMANWYQASSICTAFGMKLIDVTSSVENNNVISVIQQIEFESGNVRRIWTSGTDLGQDGRFHWDSTGHIFSFEDFRFGQPDNTNNIDNCVDINADDEFKWYDEDCLLKKYFICVKPKQPIVKGCKCINN